MKRSRLRRAGKIETAAWVLGGGLLIFYGAARLATEVAHERGLENFRQLTALAPAADAVPILDLAPQGASADASAPRDGDAVELDAIRILNATIVVPEPRLAAIQPDRTLPPQLPPDTSKWSASRIASFFGLMAAGDDRTAEAILRIDRIGLEVPVYTGTTEWNLNRGAARVEGTATIGAGNAAIAAHRDGYFRSLGELEIGDRIHAQTPGGSVAFRVSDIRIVEPTAVDVLASTDAPTLTLITCYPFYFVGPAPQRYIVIASAEEPAMLADRT